MGSSNMFNSINRQRTANPPTNKYDSNQPINRRLPVGHIARPHRKSIRRATAQQPLHYRAPISYPDRPVLTRELTHIPSSIWDTTCQSQTINGGEGGSWGALFFNFNNICVSRGVPIRVL